jgi:hypothetical protein
MSKTEALARANVLRTSLLDHGVKAVSIELVEGRGGSGWSDDHFIGSLGHHIVSRRSMGLTPGLKLVKVGRSDLPGPLCNGYGGFDEVARIICMGWANHPGLGGPLTLERGTIPVNNGRPYLFGWEHEGGIVESDWDFNGGSFRVFMGRCHAGTLDWISSERNYSLTENSHAEHKTWAPTRKVDRLGYTLAEARDELKPYLGDNMPSEGYLPLHLNDGTANQRPHKASDVAWMQARLNRAFGTALRTDGNYGLATAAVIAQHLPDANADGSGTPGRAFTGNRADDLDWALAIRAASTISSPTVPIATLDARYVRKGTKTIELS